MRKLFLDIETVPAGEEKHELLRQIHRKRLQDGKKVGSFAEYLEATSFDGSFGSIVCLSYAIDNNDAKSLHGDEKEILKSFWEIARNIDLFIGFNIMDFDLRFIYQRSIILGVRPTQWLNFARYRNNPIYDVMYEWSKWNTYSKISLHALSKALGLPSPKEGKIEGKDVAKAFLDGRIKEICQYCQKDVEVTRQIYQKMTFEE